MSIRPTVAWAMLAAVASLAVLTGCSSNDSKIYEVFKCGKAAFMLGHRAEANVAGQKGNPYLAKIDGSKAQYMMLMGQKFSDEFDLERRDPQEQLSLMADLYKSSACQTLYR